jgi:bifunctional non-homologous end joining protein LigD
MKRCIEGSGRALFVRRLAVLLSVSDRHAYDVVMARRSPSSPLPAFIRPMAAQLVQSLPDGKDWIFELKLDGYRALLMKDGDRLQIRSRNDKDLTRSYPTVAAAGHRLTAKQAIVDGEIIALDAQGRPSFQTLQHRTSHPNHQIVFYAFDVLHLDGRNLTLDPLHKRRARLPALIEGSGILFSQDLPGRASDIVRAVRRLGLEGVIAKRRTSRYQPGERSEDWVKLKLDRQQEFVIGGYRPGYGSVDALVIGYYEDKQLKFAGKVRAGLVPHARREVFARLKALHTPRCPFADLPTTGKSRWGGGIPMAEMSEMQWTKPVLVVQIRFVQWTADGRLRHASFLGVREDKTAKDVHREAYLDQKPPLSAPCM